ncbi:TetR/AcrR family transcriptional regulator [Acetobacterium woodii]|uniref:Transcriptional regulator TetR family n=1 Tax=Acetobacterium woodii (strain ATCC 29683 / DSM 1030 / JCM 2381 / KCTC 1655 / WB1) TaxID=931626 RepID=H6LCU9_ACEWD|nr:TetR/AcrR family transcriptional regulator [Acetobacterium woodii]AFA49086.1 transcriptional regulator TetR family [Acetobacterium woodii DSM 1030]
MRNETETRERLLKVAKAEFLELGYEKASIRKICKKAGVTTGALYFFFKDKNDLFADLVKKVAIEVKEVIVHHTQNEQVLYLNEKVTQQMIITDGIEQGREFVSYMYEHKDEFMLLLNKSNGSSYENFYDELVDLMEENTCLLLDYIGIDDKKKKALSRYTMHWLAHLETSSFAQLLTHDLSLEEALLQADMIAKFLSGGWLSVLGDDIVIK